MRPLEAMVILGAAALPLRLALLPGPGWPSWTPVLPAVLVALVLLHLLLEGGREGMLPAYAVVAGILLATLLPERLHHGLPGLLAGFAGLGLLAVAAALCIFHPVFQPPAPLGAQAVGTIALRLEGGPLIRIWYPADQPPAWAARPAPYMLGAREAPRPHERLAMTDALLDAPLAAAPARLPVLVFLPGWGGRLSLNTTLIQDVASSGYVVAAPDAWDPAAYPGDPLAMPDAYTPLDYSSPAALEPSLQAGRRNGQRQAALASRTLDLLTRLDAAPAGARFAGRLDLGRAGIFGFSFGGGVTAEAARTDPRFKAAVSEDGWVFTDAYEAGFPQPYLLLASPLPPAANLASPDVALRCDAEISHAEASRARAHMARHGGTFITLSGVLHGNFTDAPLASPLRGRTDAGSIDPLRARAMISALTIAFFDRHLKGLDPPLLADPAATFPEATVETWPAPPLSRSAAPAAIAGMQEADACRPS